jgi:GNAT superfamily N-acetyltransferase
VLPRPPGERLAAAVLDFTAHLVVAADVEAGWPSRILPPGSLSARLGPRFLSALADRVGAEPGALDVVLLAPPAGEPAGGPADPPRPTTAAGQTRLDGSAGDQGGPGRPREVAGDLRLTRLDGADRLDHRRLVRAHRYRDDVRAYAVKGALLVLGRGLAGRWEVAVEVDEPYQSRGLARRMIAAAPTLLPAPAPLWAQVSPGNVASMRAFLAAGYRPVGAEVLFARPAGE